MELSDLYKNCKLKIQNIGNEGIFLKVKSVTQMKWKLSIRINKSEIHYQTWKDALDLLQTQAMLNENRNCLGQFREIPWYQTMDEHRISTLIPRAIT